MNRQQRYNNNCNKVIKKIINGCKKLPIEKLIYLIDQLIIIRDSHNKQNKPFCYMTDDNKIGKAKIKYCDSCKKTHVVYFTPDNKEINNQVDHRNINTSYENELMPDTSNYDGEWQPYRSNNRY